MSFINISMPLYVVIPPGLPGTRMPQKTLYKDVWSASGILPSVSGRSKLLPPIFTVLFTTLHSILYDLSKEPEEWMDRVLEDEEEGMAMALEEEAITRFYTVVSGLPEQQREILLLCMKGEKVKEIAAKLGISENTVKTQKKRAYHFLREQLSELWAIVLPLLFGY